MLFLNKIPDGADLEPQKALSKITSLEKYSHRKPAIVKPIWLPKSVKITKFDPRYELMQNLNLFGSGILMKFKLCLSLSVYKLRGQ